MEDGAAILIIGNEILSGKVRDSNSPFLVSSLRELGYPVQRILTIPDVVPVIAEAVSELSGDFEQVLTSGGVGPTLDDVTFEGVSQAFGLPLVEDEKLSHIIRAHYGSKTTPSHLRMARVPQGARLSFSPDLPWPVVEVNNVMVLPGDPLILRKKFQAVAECFRRSPWHIRRIFTRQEEGNLAPALEHLQASWPGVALGSYPVYDNPEYNVQLTLEAKDPQMVEAALRELRPLLNAKDIVKIV